MAAAAAYKPRASLLQTDTSRRIYASPELCRGIGSADAFSAPDIAPSATRAPGELFTLTMLLRLSALVLLGRVCSALTVSCNGLFGPECIPAQASAPPSGGTTANTIEYTDRDSSWRRSDLTAELWRARGVDNWFVNFVATHPTLKTSGRFYRELASLTNLDLQGTCNLYVPGKR